MNSRPIIYYTQLYFLDSAIETINCIKYDFDIHLIIEVTSDSIQSTVLQISKNKIQPGFNDLYVITDSSDQQMLNSVFSGVKSVQVFYFSSPRSLGVYTFFQSVDLAAYMKALRPAAIHFDSTSLRAVWTIFWLRSIRILITIHDPLPHSGEYSWKIIFAQKLYLIYTSKVILYSKFARSLFDSVFPAKSDLSDNIRLLPYNYISFTGSVTTPTNQYILLFGRLSYYKGLDILLDAIPYVIKQYPDIKILIAGRLESGYILPDSVYTQQVEFISNYLSVNDLKDLIRHAKFVVCPYRDATQSGVLMTALAMHKCVVATNVGSFPEYIQHGLNGLLSFPNPIDLALNLNKALKDNYYLKLNNNICNSDYATSVLDNRTKLSLSYSSQ
jgi:glycosyltransferase involved in cell wall biosynthesis